MTRSPHPSLAVLVGVALVAALALANSDQIRERASEGIGRGIPPREGQLARGFVLGADEGIDEATKEDFRRSGLSHLLRCPHVDQNAPRALFLATQTARLSG